MKGKHKIAFGQAVRRLRRERELSQAALADNADVDRSFLSDIERGVHQPSLEVICRLAEVLRVAPEDLVARMSRILGKK